MSPKITKVLKAWAQLFLKADKAIQRISVIKTYCVIYRIEIYPVDGVIFP